MKMHLLIVTVIAGLLTACNKKDDNTDGVDNFGNCTPELVKSYNGVVLDTKSLEDAYHSGDFNTQSIKDLAYNLNISTSLYIDSFTKASCKALDYETREPVDVTVGTVQKSQEASRKILRPLNQGKPIPQKPSDVLTGAEALRRIDVNL